MLKILLVEDDPNLGELLQEFLESKHYQTCLATDGKMGVERFMNEPFDLCILDVMMPKKDGFAVAKEIRMKDSDVPIVFLTAKSMKDDTIQGFKVGADDYITKPFNMDELLLRIQAILRRYRKDNIKQPSAFQFGGYQFDSEHQLLAFEDDKQKLTSKESAILKLFCENINQALSRSFMLKMIWGDDSYFNARSMDVYLTKLRKHLRHDDTVQIVNLHGEGFKLLVG
jgi:DNA-binding response OmpR family regulator